MEQEYFYLTITSNDKDFDARQLAEKLQIYGMVAWNKGEEVDNGYIASQSFLHLSCHEPNAMEYKLNRMTISQILNLAEGLEVVLHLVLNGSRHKMSYGDMLDESLLKKLALMKAKLIVHGQLHFPKMKHEFPFVEYDKDRQQAIKPAHYASLIVYSYRHLLADISQKLGIEPNDDSFNVHDTYGNQKQGIRRFTKWAYQPKPLTITHQGLDGLDEYINDLYERKDKILALGNDIDIDYHLFITADLPDNYEFEISADSIRKLAEMRMFVDIGMMFENN